MARAGRARTRRARRATRASDFTEASLLQELPPGELSEVDLDLGRMLGGERFALWESSTIRYSQNGVREVLYLNFH